MEQEKRVRGLGGPGIKTVHDEHLASAKRIDFARLLLVDDLRHALLGGWPAFSELVCRLFC
jgi:hypothetical protein